MDINEIIDSGLLELYVLDLTTAEQTKQVDDWRVQYPLLNDEIAKIEQTVAAYVQQYATEPPADLKEKILEQLGIDFKAAPHKVTLQLKWMRFAAAASIVLLLGSVILNVIYFNNWKKSQQQVAQLEGERGNILAEADIQKATLDKYSGELKILKSPSLKVVALNSVKDGVDARVTVYWDTEGEDIFVNINNLPDAPADKQYQLWALVDGKPVDAGVMELTLDNLQKLKSIDKAQAFAITLENKGGAISPTLEQMIVLGTV